MDSKTEMDTIKSQVHTLQGQVDSLCKWLQTNFGFNLIVESYGSTEPPQDCLSAPIIHDDPHNSAFVKNKDHSYSSPASLTTKNLIPELIVSRSPQDTFNTQRQIFPRPPPEANTTVSHSKEVPLMEEPSERITFPEEPRRCKSVKPSRKLNNVPSQCTSEEQDPQEGVNVNVSTLSPSPYPPKKSKRKPKPKPVKTSTTTGDSSTKSPSTIMCEVCGKLISAVSGAVKRHRQTHTGVRPFPCPHPSCGKSFQRNFHLKTHLMIHNGEKKHQCRFCGKLFLLPKDIVAHERVHTGEKPFACPHTNCGRSFTLKSHLTMHVRTHTGEKPYQCELCDKKFSQANSLRVHKKTHLAPSEPPPDTPLNLEAPVPTPEGEEEETTFDIVGQLIPISISSELLSELQLHIPTTTTASGASDNNAATIQILHSLVASGETVIINNDNLHLSSQQE